MSDLLFYVDFRKIVDNSYTISRYNSLNDSEELLINYGHWAYLSKILWFAWFAKLTSNLCCVGRLLT